MGSQIMKVIQINMFAHLKRMRTMISMIMKMSLPRTRRIRKTLKTIRLQMITSNMRIRRLVWMLRSRIIRLTNIIWIGSIISPALITLTATTIIIIESIRVEISLNQNNRQLLSANVRLGRLCIHPPPLRQAITCIWHRPSPPRPNHNFRHPF